MQLQINPSCVFLIQIETKRQLLVCIDKSLEHYIIKQYRYLYMPHSARGNITSLYKRRELYDIISNSFKRRQYCATTLNIKYVSSQLLLLQFKQQLLHAFQSNTNKWICIHNKIKA